MHVPLGKPTGELEHVLTWLPGTDDSSLSSPPLLHFRAPADILQSACTRLQHSLPCRMAAVSEAFFRWVDVNGAFMHPQLSLFHALASGDRGVVAQERINQGEELVSVPLDACIHMPTEEEWAQYQASPWLQMDYKCRKESSKMQKECWLLQAGNRQLDEATVFLKSGLAQPLNTFLSTTLLLLHELGKVGTTSSPNIPLTEHKGHALMARPAHVQGQHSRFKPYLDTMPASHDCTLLWSDDEMAELVGRRPLRDDDSACGDPWHILIPVSFGSCFRCAQKAVLFMLCVSVGAQGQR